jgi:farnesyl diphosphate synthase
LAKSDENGRLSPQQQKLGLNEVFMSNVPGLSADASAIPEAGKFTALRQRMEKAARDVDALLDRVLPQPRGLHGRIHEAMRYAVFAGGKRLRPFLVLRSADLFGVDVGCALRVAAALEVLHTYSLVHDDLPCMDDDDLRRGRPTTHVAFDEATAVLAGDALLTVAFEILAQPETHPSAEVRCRLMERLAKAAGHDGMIGGQIIDIEAENRPFGADDTITLQQMKTGALFEFACAAGPVLAEAPSQDHDRLSAYARDFGLVFQITDDLLDVLGSAEKVGKSVGKDQEQGKATLVSLLGVEGARLRAVDLAERSTNTLAYYGDRARDLRDLVFYLLDRES